MNNTISGLPRLSREYNEGYRNAIQDITEVFSYVNDDLRMHGTRMNYLWADKILKCCLENREKIRENRKGFFRIEKSDNGEWDAVKWFDGRD